MAVSPLTTIYCIPRIGQAWVHSDEQAGLDPYPQRPRNPADSKGVIRTPRKESGILWACGLRSEGVWEPSGSVTMPHPQLPLLGLNPLLTPATAPGTKVGTVWLGLTGELCQSESSFRNWGAARLRLLPGRGRTGRTA